MLGYGHVHYGNCARPRAPTAVTPETEQRVAAIRVTGNAVAAANSSPGEGWATLSRDERLHFVRAIDRLANSFAHSN